MIYVLEGLVYYRSDDGSLWMKGGEEEKIVLSPIVSRLLLLFFQNPGKILTRDEIMHRVWEIHGLEPSNNSLNQYVSQIRKIMHNYAMPDDIISTIPRVGFKFSGEVNITTEPSEHSVISEPANALPLLTEAQPDKPRNNKILLICIALSILFIITPFITKGLSGYVNTHNLNIAPVQIGVSGSCPVYSVMMGNISSLKESMFQANQYINKHNISCHNNGGAVYFYAQNSIINNHGGRLFLAFCESRNKELLLCMSYAYHTWM